MKKINLKKTFRGIMTIKEEAKREFDVSDFSDRHVLITEAFEELQMEDREESYKLIGYLYDMNPEEIRTLIEQAELDGRFDY